MIGRRFLVCVHDATPADARQTRVMIAGRSLSSSLILYSL
jgi:hypothetical protein